MKDRLLLLAFFISGAAALGYEILWTRLLALALGSETLGVLATLAGFFAGLALGSFWLHGPARRAARPVRLFALLEGIAAAYALVSPHLLAWLARRLPAWLGPAAGDNDTLLALACSLLTATVVLLPGTFPMGATLAALVEARRRARPGDPDEVGLGRLYAANTAGATAGTLGTVFLLLPGLGLVAGSAALAATGLLAAAVALLWERRATASPQGSTPPAPPRPSPGPSRVDAPRAAGREILLLGLTGLAGLGLEVVGLQIMTQKLENTVYTFAIILAVYLVGTAAGAFLYARRWAPRPPGRERAVGRRRDELTAHLLLALALSVVGAAVALRRSPALLAWLAPAGSGVPRHHLAELTLAAAVFLLPTLLMGALFSHLMAVIAPAGVGRAYAVNTLGATVAPFAFGLGAMRSLGYAPALYLAALLYLALFFVVAWSGGLARGKLAAGVAAGLLACLVGPRSMLLVPVEPGFRRVAHAEGLMGLVLVTEEVESTLPGRRLHRRLQVDQHFRMGGSVSFGEQRLGHLPLLLAPGARTALFLGVGTGATLSAVRHFPLDRVEAVELVPEVLGFLPLFDHVNESVVEDPRVRFHAADARRFLAATAERFDVIVGDLFHPARDGAGALYSREHFAIAREHLAPGGLFAQWIPLYQFDPDSLKTVVRAFLAVFPEAGSFLGIYNAQTPALALVGRAGGGPWVDLEALEGRLREPVYRRLLLDDARDFMAAYMLDGDALAAFAGEGPLNTDLAPRLLFDAPESAYERRPDLNWSSLVLVMEHREVYPEGLIAGEPERLAAFRSQVAAFSRALTFYLRGDVLRLRDGGLSPAALDNYLSAYATEASFQPATRLLRAAAAADPPLAVRLLPLMLEVAPDDAETHRLYLAALERLGEHEGRERALAEARARFGPAF